MASDVAVDEQRRGRALDRALEMVGSLEDDDRERLVSLFDTTASNEMIVARHGPEITELVGIGGWRALLRWVAMVRPPLIEQAAWELNQCSDYLGGGRVSGRPWIVCRGQLVVEGGIAHRDLLARDRRRPPATVVWLFRRGHARRRRVAGRSRTRCRVAASDDPSRPRRSRRLTPGGGWA